jgi:hypothetical protein
MGVGAVLGVVAAVASGGITLVEGVAIGGGGGGVIGSLFHKGLGMSEDDAARIGSRLDTGHAAVGVLARANQVPAITAELESLGGEPETHEVAPEVAATVATATPSG